MTTAHWWFPGTKHSTGALATLTVFRGTSLFSPHTMATSTAEEESISSGSRSRRTELSFTTIGWGPPTTSTLQTQPRLAEAASSFTSSPQRGTKTTKDAKQDHLLCVFLRLCGELLNEHTDDGPGDQQTDKPAGEGKPALGRFALAAQESAHDHHAARANRPSACLPS